MMQIPDEQLIRADYWRAAMYADLRATLADIKPSGSGCEFGGSNGVLQSYMPAVRWETRDYPPHDVLDPATWDPGWDVVVLDQILEHVSRPWEVIGHIGRATRELAVITVPFLIGVHPCPEDFWRMTPSALSALCQPFFKRMQISTWGSAIANYYHALYQTTDKLLSVIPYEVAHEVLLQNDHSNPFMVWAVLRR